MKFELVFLRHGESTSNLIHTIPGEKWDMLVELTENGKEQAKKTKKILQDEKFDCIFYSDMLRAIQTMNIIFDDTYKKIPDKRLREYVISKRDTIIDHPSILTQKRVNMRLNWFEDWESFAEQIERVKSFMDMILTGEYWHKIIIFTHSWCLRALNCIYHNMPMEESLRHKKTENCWIKRVYITKDQNGISFSEE